MECQQLTDSAIRQPIVSRSTALLSWGESPSTRTLCGRTTRPTGLDGRRTARTARRWGWECRNTSSSSASSQPTFPTPTPIRQCGKTRRNIPGHNGRLMPPHYGNQTGIDYPTLNYFSICRWTRLKGSGLSIATSTATITRNISRSEKNLRS